MEDNWFYNSKGGKSKDYRSSFIIDKFQVKLISPQQMSLAYPNLQPFDETYVLYDGKSITAFVLVFFTLLPIFIMVFIFSWFVSTRELEACIMAFGHVVNDVINIIVKKLVKEDRPTEMFEAYYEAIKQDVFKKETYLESCIAQKDAIKDAILNKIDFQKDSQRSGYGMPSAHSQFMGFFFGYLLLRILYFWKFDSKLTKRGGILLLIISTVLTPVSRVVLGYHSIMQVTVGVVLGMFLGSSYFIVCQYIRRFGITEWIVNLPISKYMMVKDSSYRGSISLKEEREQWLKRCKETKKN